MTTAPPTSPAVATGARDDAAIRQVVANTERFQSDPARFTELLTEQVVIINLAGVRVRGREELRRVMTRALQTRLAQVMTTTELTDITFVRPDVALVSCVKHITDTNADAAASVPATGRLTFVVVKEEQRWRIALAQTTPIQA